MKLYPVFLKLNGKACLVVGGGRVAERKTGDLIKASARVTVISPELTENLALLEARKEISVIRRNYKNGDLKRFFLAIAATDSEETNAIIARDALKYGVLLNTVDSPSTCNFYVPACLSRGELLIAVSTSGAAPALAKKIRDYIGRKIGEGVSEKIEELKNLRKKIIVEEKDRGRKHEKIKETLAPLIDSIVEGFERP